MGENIDTSFIIERFGSLEEFKKQYIQALIDNKPISQLDKNMKACIKKYKEQLVIGFDITQPNLIAVPEMIRLTLLEEVSSEYKKIGNFYNQKDINEKINSELCREDKIRMFKYFYGIDGERMGVGEVAKLFDISFNKVYNFKNSRNLVMLRNKITQIGNSELDKSTREEFIRKYFEQNSIFKDDNEMSKEERDKLIELYNRGLENVRKENEIEGQQSIDNLNLRTQTRNTLRKAKVTTIDKLLEKLSKGEKIQGIGETYLGEIEKALLAKGYNLEELQSENAKNEELAGVVKLIQRKQRILKQLTDEIDRLKETAISLGMKPEDLEKLKNRDELRENESDEGITI